MAGIPRGTRGRPFLAPTPVPRQIMDLIVRLIAPKKLTAVAASLKRILGALSPQYNLARGLYDVQATYSTGGW